jgi:hypothetical protein
MVTVGAPPSFTTGSSDASDEQAAMNKPTSKVNKSDRFIVRSNLSFSRLWSDAKVSQMLQEHIGRGKFPKRLHTCAMAGRKIQIP